MKLLAMVRSLKLARDELQIGIKLTSKDAMRYREHLSKRGAASADSIVLLSVDEPLVTTVYEARAEIDHEEGRAGTRVMGHYEMERDAREAVKGQGIFGGPGHVEEKSAIWISDNEFYVVPGSHPEMLDGRDKVRIRALAKLTEEERKVLGV